MDAFNIESKKVVGEGDDRSMILQAQYLKAFIYDTLYVSSQQKWSEKNKQTLHSNIVIVLKIKMLKIK